MRKLGKLLSLAAMLVFFAGVQAVPADAAGGKPAEVYVDGKSGSDTNDGLTASTEFKTIEKAQETVQEGGTIWITGKVSYWNCGQVTLEHVNLKRHDSYKGASGTNGALLHASADTELTLKNVTVDGNRGDAGAPMIYINQGAVVNMEEGTVLTNHAAAAVEIATGKSTFVMNGGEISGNHYGGAVNKGAVLLAADGMFYMNGGAVCGNSYPKHAAVFAPSSSSGTVGGIYVRGGRISDNTGIGVKSQIPVEVSGSARITANSLMDVYLYGSETCTLTFGGAPGIGTVELEKHAADRLRIVEDFSPAAPILLKADRNFSPGDVVAAVADGAAVHPNAFRVGEGGTCVLVKENGELVVAETARVDFYAQRGQEPYFSLTVPEGSTLDSSAVEQPAARTGYTFGNQWEDADGRVWDFAADKVSGDTQLYAVWTLNAPQEVRIRKEQTGQGASALLRASAQHEREEIRFLYQWYKDGTAISGADRKEYAASASGEYAVEVRASDGVLVSEEAGTAKVTLKLEVQEEAAEKPAAGGEETKAPPTGDAGSAAVPALLMLAAAVVGLAGRKTLLTAENRK